PSTPPPSTVSSDTRDVRIPPFLLNRQNRSEAES
ncbi:MAG: hypothetical protein RLZZ468_1418, partial [Cyanobacteriota bacterium]